MSGVASLGRFSEISAPPRANDVDMNPDQSRNAARRGLLWFGALVFAFSVTLEVSMARTGRPIGELGPISQLLPAARAGREHSRERQDA